MAPSPITYGNFTDEFVDELAELFQGKRVLEVFAGNGSLASKLGHRGVDIVATSEFSGHDGHHQGMWHPVVDMEASEAVASHGADADVLLMSWPTADEGATKALITWGHERSVIFIGEVTRLDWGLYGLGGCASDLFFEITEIERDIPSYEPRNKLERAVVLRLSEERLRAAFRKRAEEMDGQASAASASLSLR